MAVRAGTLIAVLLSVGGLPSAARSQSAPDGGRPYFEDLQPARGRPTAGTVLRAPIEPRPSPSVGVVRSPPGAWGGAPETLREAWAIALAVDQRLAAKRWDFSSTQHSLRSAQAERWPTMNVEGSYNVRNDETAFQIDFPAIPLSSATFPYAQDEGVALRADLSLPLYTSGRIQHGIAAASAQADSVRLELQAATMGLKLRVAEEYVSVLRAQREVDLAQRTVCSLGAHLRDVESLFKHGQVPVNDLLAAQVALSDARQHAIQARNQLDAGHSAYNRRLARPLTTPVRLAEVTVEPVNEDLETLTARALRMRPEVARLKALCQALRHRAGSLRATNGPQIALEARYAFEENRFRAPEGIAEAGVGISWNVFDGGRNRHQAAAVLDKAEGLARLESDLESTIALQTREAWLDVHETRQRLDVTAEAIQQAEENLRVARKRYASGTGTSTEVLDAETLRAQAHRNHYNASCDAVLAVLRLRYATGELKGP
jgi:outer membrane protein